MRTTLDIPKELIDEAMKVTGAATKSQLIKDALQAEIDRAKRKRLIARKGTLDLDIDLDALRDRNRDKNQGRDRNRDKDRDRG